MKNLFACSNIALLNEQTYIFAFDINWLRDILVFAYLSSSYFDRN